MANEKNGTTPSNEPEDLAALYARYRREFSAADLQKYTEIEEGIPAEQVLAELEEIHRQEAPTCGE